MFWIIVLVIFVVLSAALALIVRSRGGGSGEGSGVDNHDALQKGIVQSGVRRGSGGFDGPGGFGPTN